MELTRRSKRSKRYRLVRGIPWWKLPRARQGWKDADVFLMPKSVFPGTTTTGRDELDLTERMEHPPSPPEIVLYVFLCGLAERFGQPFGMDDERMMNELAVKEMQNRKTFWRLRASLKARGWIKFKPGSKRQFRKASRGKTTIYGIPGLKRNRRTDLKKGAGQTHKRVKTARGWDSHQPLKAGGIHG